MSIMQAMLFNRGGDPIQITDQTCTHSNPGLTATAGYKLQASGQAQKRGSSYANITGEWLLAGGVASNYKAKATLQTGGPLTTNTLSAYTTLGSSDESFTLVATGGDVSATVLVEIARVSDSVVVDSATMTLNALGAP